MKIVKITFKNINNLRGQHELSFDKHPLSDAGIFAITGPTGSGKSTILDVITLALFNKVPRFKNASNKEVVISKKQIQDHGSIMTHHTNESYAAIDYVINNRKYTSEWTLSKTRTGNLKDYEMSIYDALGKPLDLKKSEVPSKNEEIIGLNYAQFVKSIILSQGEFSKFLKADKNERGKLLENITGTSIYRKIGIAAFEKEKIARENIEKLREHLDIIEILSSDQLEDVKNKSKNAKITKTKADKEIAILSKILTSKSNLKKKKQELEAKRRLSSILLEQKQKQEPYVLKLSIHEKLSPLQVKLALHNEVLINKTKTSENLVEYKSSHKQSNGNLDQVINEMANLTKSKVDHSTFKKVMTSFEREINDLDRDLVELKSKGTEERNRINIKNKSYPFSISSTPEEAIIQLQNRQKDIKTKLDIANLTLENNIAQLKEKLKSKRETVALFQNIHRENDLLILVDKNLQKTSKDLELFELKKEKLSPQLTSASELTQILREKVELLLQQKRDAERIERLEDIRHTLKEGQPCPLCGATDHPYSAHSPSTNTAKIDESIHIAKTKLSLKESVVKELEKETAKVQTTIDLSGNQIDSLKKQLNELDRHIQKLIGQHQGKEKIDLNNLSGILKKSQIQERLLDEGIDALEEYKINIELNDLYRSLNGLMIQYKSKSAIRQKKYEGHDVSGLCNALQDRFEASKTSLERLKVSIDKETADLKRADQLVESISNELSPQLLELGFNDLNAANESLLQKEEIDQIRRNKEDLAKSITSNQTEIVNIEKDIAKLTSEDSKKEMSIDKMTSDISLLEKERDSISQQIGQLESILERDRIDRQKIKEKEKEIKIAEKEYEKWSLMKKLIGDANGNNFANFAQGLTLQNLLVFANKRLSNLSDRYLLDMPSQEGFLNVVDLYQGNTQRAVTTLSGGESFLISLALALSLSDMASQNVSLDSLFIDEGFGTLDQETLDIAINTLEKLQSESQKTVGVISHVEALKERINVQIRMNKNAQGYSEIEVLS